MKQSDFPKIGAFISFRQPDYLTGLWTQTKAIGGNAVMFFAGPPQAMRVTDWRKLNCLEFMQLRQQANWTAENICIHAHYLINLANLINPVIYQKSLDLLKAICEFAAATKIRYIILHPGSALKQDRQLAIKQIARSLDRILANYPTVTICLETMSGKGSELGKTFDELNQIIKYMRLPNQVMVCWDTCHLYSAGYDIKNHLEQVLTEFDQLIGLSKLKFIHLNDSKHPFNSRTDRHANLGAGSLGWSAFFQLIRHPLLRFKTFILETPNQNQPAIYRAEIATLRNHVI